MLWRWTLLVSAAAGIGGCGGEYMLIGPDVAALPGQTAPVVVRLQRREFWFYWPPMEDAAITFRSDGGELRCARTDEDGYAAVGFPAPAGPGMVQVALHHQDELGYTVAGHVHVFALSPEEPMVAVDMDSLPAAGKKAASAAGALRRAGKEMQIVYFTQEWSAAPGRAHEFLEKTKCPFGAVIPWERKGRWYARNPFRRRRRCPVEALRERFPNLRWAVSADAASAERFDKAGLKVLVVGDAPARVESAEYFKSWSDLSLDSTAEKK